MLPKVKSSRVYQEGIPLLKTNTLPTERALSLSEYLSNIPDALIRQFVSEIAKIRMRETYSMIERLTKTVWDLSLNQPNFMNSLSTHLQSNSMAPFMAPIFSQSTNNEMTSFNNWLKSLKLIPSQTNPDDVIADEVKGPGTRPMSNLIDEIKDIINYKHLQVMKRLTVQRFVASPVQQTMNDLKLICNFNSLHKSSVNCVDICPFSKLLVTASSDGTAKFVDLGNKKQIKEVIIKDSRNKEIRSICIDDKLNVAFVNQDNKMRLFNIQEGIITAEYQGEVLPDYTDFIPNQAVQFTSDFNFIAFRASATKIIMFDMATKAIVKEYNSIDKIYDYSISPKNDLIANAIYSDCMLEMIDMNSGEIVSSFKLDCNSINLTVFRSYLYCTMDKERNPPRSRWRKRHHLLR